MTAQRYILLRPVTVRAPVSEEDGDYTAPAGAVADGHVHPGMEPETVSFGSLPSRVGADSTSGWGISWEGRIGEDVIEWRPAFKRIADGVNLRPDYARRLTEAGFNHLLAVTDEPSEIRISLYGSRVSGHARPNSDLDIGYQGCTAAEAEAIVRAMIQFPSGIELDLAEGVDYFHLPGRPYRAYPLVGEVGTMREAPRGAIATAIRLAALEGRWIPGRDNPVASGHPLDAERAVASARGYAVRCGVEVPSPRQRIIDTAPDPRFESGLSLFLKGGGPNADGLYFDGRSGWSTTPNPPRSAEDYERYCSNHTRG